jgi:tight adherence protein C
MGVELAVVAVAAGFVAALLGAYAVSDYFLERRRVVQQLRTMESFELAPTDVRARELAAPARTRLVFPGARRLGEAARRLTPAGVTERLREELVYAGSPRGWDAERILVAKLLLAAGLGVLAFISGVAGGVEPALVTVMVLVGAFVGWFVPEWILRGRSGARQDEIGRTLPDALDLLSITVEAGLGFDAALQRVAREMGGPLGQELFRVVQEMRLGKSRQAALRGLADRSKVSELKEFVLAMIQADTFGIAITQVLKIQADELRIKRRQVIEEEAQKVPVKMIFPLIMCILPATFIVLAGPAVLRIVDFFGDTGL